MKITLPIIRFTLLLFLALTSMASAQSPKITGVTIPNEVELGDEITIEITGRNYSTASSEAYLTISFPELNQSGDNSLITSSSGSSITPDYRYKGDEKGVYPKDSTSTINTQYLMAEIWDKNWTNGETNTIKLKVKVDRADSNSKFHVYYRCWMRKSSNSYTTSPSVFYTGGALDQQNYTVFVKEINVTQPPSPADLDASFSLTSSMVWGETASPTTVRVDNDGETDAENVTIRLFASKNKVAGDGDYLIDEWKNVDISADGSWEMSNYTWDLPDDPYPYTGMLESGTGYFILWVSQANGETITTNNTNAEKVTMSAYVASASATVRVRTLTGGVPDNITGRTIVQRWTGTAGSDVKVEKVANAQGEVVFDASEMVAGQLYTYDVYYEGDNVFDNYGEFWIRKAEVAESGDAVIILKREKSYTSDVRFSVNGSPVDSASEIFLGSTVDWEVEVTNNESIDRKVAIEFWMDRDEAGSVDHTSGVSNYKEVLKNEGTTTFSGSFVLSDLGQYSYAPKVTEQNQGKTDSWKWVPVFTVVTSKASLEATLANISGSPYTPQNVRWSIGGVAKTGNPVTVTDLDEGSIAIKAWQDGSTPWGEELWFLDNTTVSADDPGKTFVRNAPYIHSVSLHDSSGASLGMASSLQVTKGETYTFKCKVNNPRGSATNTRLRVRFDRDQSAEDWDHDPSSSSSSIPGGANEQEFAVTFTPQTTGAYSYTFAIEWDVSSEWTVVDSDQWYDAFEVIAPITDAAEIVSVTDASQSTVSPGSTLTHSVIIENTGTTRRSFWLGLSVATPSAGVWPSGWMDINPIETNVLDPAERQTIKMEVQLPLLMENGSYHATFAVWNGYDANSDLMKTPQFDQHTMATFSINQEFDSDDPYDIKKLDPDPVNYFDKLKKASRVELHDLNARITGLQQLRVDNREFRRLNQTDENIIVLIHGWTDGFCDYGSPTVRRGSDLNDLYNAIVNDPRVNKRWSVIRYDWSHDALTSTPWWITPLKVDSNQEDGPALCDLAAIETSSSLDLVIPGDIPKLAIIPVVAVILKAVETTQIITEGYAELAAERSYQHGLVMGSQILHAVAENNLKRVHLVAHSAGSWNAYAAAKVLRHNRPSLEIQITYLDPYIPDEGLTYAPLYRQHPFMSSDTLKSSVDHTISNTPGAFECEAYYTENDETEGILGFQYISDATTVKWNWDVVSENALTQDVAFFEPDDWETNGHGSPTRFYKDSLTRNYNVDSVLVGWQRSLAYNAQIALSHNQAVIQAGLSGVDAEPSAEPFKDGASNLLKFAFNMDLSTSDSATMGEGGTSGLPLIYTSGSGASKVLRIEYLRRKNSDLVYSLEISGNMTDFTEFNNVNFFTESNIDDEWERVILTAGYNGSISAGSLFARVRVVMGSDEEVTVPVGWESLTLDEGFNLIGLRMHQPILLSGVFGSPSGTTLPTGKQNLSSILGASGSSGRVLIEVIEGDHAGLLIESETWTSSGFTGIEGLSSSLAGDRFQVRRASTLSDVFGSNNSAGLLEGDIETADIVWVATGGGGYDRYYYSEADPDAIPSPVTKGWKDALGRDASSDSINYLDGVFIERKLSGAFSIGIMGSVKTYPVSLDVFGGGTFTAFGSIFPTGTTLQDSKLQDVFKHGDVEDGDVIWMPSEPGKWDRFTYQDANPDAVPSPVTEGWKNALGIDASEQEVTSGLFIQRNGVSIDALFEPNIIYRDLR